MLRAATTCDNVCKVPNKCPIHVSCCCYSMYKTNESQESTEEAIAN